jgi:hypothetical protein
MYSTAASSERIPGSLLASLHNRIGVELRAACRCRLVLARSLALLPALCMLSACNGTADLYQSGPWGYAPRIDPARPLYSSPWAPPPHEPVEEAYYVPPPAPVIMTEPMEPIGPWASRHAPQPFEPDLLPQSSLEPTAPLPEKTPNAPERLSVIVSKAAPEDRVAEREVPAARFTSLTGAWKIQENGSNSCRLQLSSVSTLDLYKASSTRCTSATLQDVNAWNVEGGDLVLFSRGRIVSRLRGGNSTFFGTLEGSGTAIRLTR